VTGSALRVVLVDDVRLYREGLAAVLGRDPHFLVEAASSRPEAMHVVQQRRPDVVIVSVGMPGAYELMSELRACVPAPQVIAFAVDDHIQAVVRCAEAGAAGYVTVNAGVSDLLTAIERAAGGEILCSARMAGELFRHVGHRSRTQGTPVETAPLTGRQRQVLALVRQGLSNKEIAAALHISEATVKNHVHHLLDKLQVSSRTQAAVHLPEPHRLGAR